VLSIRSFFRAGSIPEVFNSIISQSKHFSDPCPCSSSSRVSSLGSWLVIQIRTDQKFQHELFCTFSYLRYRAFDESFKIHYYNKLCPSRKRLSGDIFVVKASRIQNIELSSTSTRSHILDEYHIDSSDGKPVWSFIARAITTRISGAGLKIYILDHSSCRCKAKPLQHCCCYICHLQADAAAVKLCSYVVVILSTDSNSRSRSCKGDCEIRRGCRLHARRAAKSSIVGREPRKRLSSSESLSSSKLTRWISLPNYCSWIPIFNLPEDGP
jgi:hypothetical protein